MVDKEQSEDLEKNSKGVGGKYTVYNSIVARCILDEDITFSVTPQDVMKNKGLCYKSVSKSLNSLARMGLLIKTSGYEIGTGRKFVRYSVNSNLVFQYLGGLFQKPRVVKVDEVVQDSDVDVLVVVSDPVNENKVVGVSKVGVDKVVEE